MKTTISNIGQMRAVNKGLKPVAQPFHYHVFHAEQLHLRISDPASGIMGMWKQYHDTLSLDYIRKSLTAGR